MKIKVLFAAILVVASNFSMAKPFDERVKLYIDVFTNGSIAEQKKASSSLMYQGLSDARLFDLIEKKIVQRYRTTNDKSVSWLIIALGFSGLEKYELTLEKIIEDDVSRAYTKHALNSLNNISWYMEWNKIISDKSTFNSKQTDEVNRFANMLRSNDYQLIRIAAKRIHYQHLYPEYLLDVLQETVRNHYNDPVYDRYQPDAVAWMLKALAGSRNRKYIPVIDEVIHKAKNRKIVSHAKKYLRYY